MRINFKEVPEAAGGTEGADTWEFFARDFLMAIGLKHESGPDRGADDGRDLIMVEHRSGPLRQSSFRWVVSCKHKAHSQKAVSDREEIDPAGRVRRFNADGFLAFYSTLPSGTLGRTFERLQGSRLTEVFDAARIEHELLSNAALKTVFRRYFPQSRKAWESARREPFPIADRYEPLVCCVCGKDMLVTEGKIGNIIFVYAKDGDAERVVNVYPCCKECDRVAASRFRTPGLYDRWMDLANAAIPRHFFNIVFGLMNELDSKRILYEPSALKQFKQIILRIAQVVVRETSRQQRQQLRMLDELPF